MAIELNQQLEAILFYLGEPTDLKTLAKYTGAKTVDIEGALKVLESKLAGRGLVLVRTEDTVMLGTTSDASELIEKITKEELSRDLGRAGLETLAIIVYKGGAAKREIDYIRGVNSSFILRNLLIRGLVEREEKAGERSFVYKPTLDLLSFMGLSHTTDMPEFEQVKKELETFMSKPEEIAETAPNA